MPRSLALVLVAAAGRSAELDSPPTGASVVAEPAPAPASRLDGTCSQQADLLGAEVSERSFRWTFEDDVIDLGGSTYTVVERGPGEMVCRNDLLGDYYAVERQ